MNVSHVEIRPLSAADIDQLVGMESANQPVPWTEGVFSDEISSDSRAYYAAFDGDQLLGYGGVMVNDEEAHVTNLLVAPDRRGEGLGRRLLHDLFIAALSMGARHLTLEVRSRNEGAIALYRRFGLAPVGVRPGYYGDDDAMIMWVHDINTDSYAARLEKLA
jgi:[ribosomal protein S18]-alanine N-acetyltransferase